MYPYYAVHCRGDHDHSKSCVKNILRWSALAGFFSLMVVFARWIILATLGLGLWFCQSRLLHGQTENADLKNDVLLQSIIEFEQRFWGHQVDCEFVNSKNGKYKRYRHLVSHDGQVCAVERDFESFYALPGGKNELQRTLITSYDNGEYTFETYQQQDESLRFFANVGDARGAVGGSEFAAFFGYSPIDQQQLSFLLSDTESQFEIASATMFGNLVTVLNVDVPQRGRYSFFFDLKASRIDPKISSPILIGFRVDKTKGHLYRFGGDEVILGEAKPNSQASNFHLQKISKCRYVVGPIIYDELGFPVRAGIEVEQREFNEPSRPIKFLISVTSYVPLADRLAPNEIYFGQITANIPDVARVEMRGSTGLPYELRSKKLVMLVDGASLSGLQTSGFRQPTSPYRWFVPLSVILIAIMCVIWWLRNR